jgi:cytochrome c oxidase subunit II
MTGVTARFVVAAGLVAAIAFPTLSARSQAGSTPADVVIKLTAKKFEYSQKEIRVVLGKRVRIEITATDHDHGFEIKDLKMKASIKQGKTEVLEFTADKVGEYEFKCSTFCGMGHGGMKGKLIVTAPR